MEQLQKGDLVCTRSDGRVGRVAAISPLGHEVRVLWKDTQFFENDTLPVTALHFLEPVDTPERKAARLIQQAQHHLTKAQSILDQLKAMHAHEAEGLSWPDFLEAHFGKSLRWFQRQAYAVEVRATLHEMIPDLPGDQLDALTESACREFPRAEKALWADIYSAAMQINPGKVTAKAVKQATETFTDVLEHCSIDGVPLPMVVASGAVDALINRKAAGNTKRVYLSRKRVLTFNKIHIGEPVYRAQIDLTATEVAAIEAGVYVDMWYELPEGDSAGTE